MYSVFDINGNVKCEVAAFEYRGEFMSVSSIVATIKSSTPIDFANGDYISFRGEKYTLRYTPAYKKQARKDTYSEAFVYDSMVFYAASDELTRCDFLDVVKADNNIHYTSLPNFTFYAESVQELADRIKANLDRLYKGANAWTIKVAEGTVSKPHNFTCSNIKCWDALVLANTELDLNFIIKGRTITIGSVGSAIEHEFSYGKGNGLKDLSSSTSESAAIVTRLRAYGSTRNLPYRYYNKLYIDSYGNVKYFKDTPSSGYSLLLSESMYMPNLMLPMLRKGSLIGNTGDLYNEDGIPCGKYRLGGTIGKDAYIESVAGIEKYGINEGTVFFDTDTEDGEDNIYPSMEGITAQQLIDAGFDIQLDAGDNGNLDEIYSAEVMTDDGYLPDNGSDINPSSFKVTLKDIGFNISDYLLPGESAQIYFASGELVGRTFEIASITKSGKKQILQVNRLLDSDIEWVFPNKHYNAKAGDKFKLINIYMPDEYVIAAEFRLLDRAKLYLAENDHNTINYAPTIDDIFLARNPQIAESIREGDIFTFSDDDLDLYKSITISTISIKIGESLIPKYSITLSENKDATLVDRITSQVSDSLGKTYLSSDNIVSLSKLQFDKRYLRKDVEDTATKKIILAGGAVADHLTSTTYTSGFGGKGYELKMEDGESQITIDKAVIRDDAQIGGGAAISGNASVGGQLTTDNITSSDYNGEFTGFTLKDTEGGSYLEVDKLNVRKKAVFRELGIKKIDHIGGANVTSPASCKIDAVDLNFPAVDLIDANGKKFYAADGEFLVLSDIADGYKCYFNATDGDKTIHNEWKVGDQALCHAFNLTTPRYYWRLVTAVSVEPIDGFHCVVLSMSDCDTDSDVPMAEDTIVCFGNRTDKDRQSVIIMDSEGASAPYLRQLKGINSYNISDANIVTQLSPTKNIIRGETIELSTSSGNKGVQDLANDALKNAKKYTDTAFGDAKKYTDTSLGSAKEYADGVLGSAKEYADGIKELANSYTDSALGDAKSYADGVGTSALNAAKTYADGVSDTAETNAKGYADGVGSTVKGYADGLFADAENYTQEREAYLQSQITANANGIGLCATKTELQSVSDGVNTLATRVTSAEASIKVNADGITALANKTEVDITTLGNRISSAEASIQVNAGNIALKANQTDLETVKNSVNGLTTRMTSAETKITQNANAIKLKASKDDLTAVSNAVGGLETRMTAAESSLTVQADRISSVVSEYEGLVKQYGYADFTIKCGWLAGTWITNAQGNNIGSPMGYEKDTACQLMILTDVEKGDAIRVVPKAKTQQAVVQIYGCDGDAQGAEQDAFNLIGEDVANYTWYGRSTTLVNNFDIDKDGSAEYAVPVDCREVHIWLSDDWSEKANIQVFHIKAKISAQSRIDQTADNIRLQVGEAGINLDSKVITLDASKTIVTGDLAVSVVKTYWDAAQTQIKSAYNGNGEGTIVYYYPNGQVMKEDKFVSDTSGNIVGMRTTYYKANGEVAWVIDEGGFLTTLPDYWEVLNNGNKMCFATDEAAMMEILTQHLGEAMQYFSEDKFSRFVGTSQQYKDYSGKVSKAVRSSENPTDAMLWAGVLIYSVELYKDGARPTYIVTYEVCTTALGQVGAIVTKKFNSLGEI